MTPYTWAEKFESFEPINSIRETIGNFDSCNSCKRLVSSRLHEMNESKFSFVSRIEFFRSKLSNFSAHVYGVTERRAHRPGRRGRITSDLRRTAEQDVFIMSSTTFTWAIKNERLGRIKYKSETKARFDSFNPRSGGGGLMQPPHEFFWAGR